MANFLKFLSLVLTVLTALKDGFDALHFAEKEKENKKDGRLL